MYSGLGLLRSFIVILPILFAAGCTSLPSSGPNRSTTVELSDTSIPIPVIAIDDSVTSRMRLSSYAHRFSDIDTNGSYPLYVVGPGDVLAISVWEAPPAMLFGSMALAGNASVATTNMSSFPEQMVTSDGSINVPFAGKISVGGMPVRDIENSLIWRLTGKANQPQAMVRVVHNASSNVTVVGEVAQSQRMPLTARGERLLDAIAVAGGVRVPVGQVTIQLSREGGVVSMPLDVIIRDPRQNIRLQPGDVVTALHQPHSFTALGAVGRNEEVPFEAKGITLAQAFGRIGGLNDSRADATGVFIFRFEDPAVLPESALSMGRTDEGRIPVVYQADLKNPASFLLAQGFPMRDKDVLYVSNAPTAELQKFLSILTSSIYSVRSVVDFGN